MQNLIKIDMENKIEIGDRVDVNRIITEPWQTEHWLKNAILYDIEYKVNRYNKNIISKFYKIGRDEKTTHSHMGLMFCVGKLSENSFNILKS